MPRCPFKIALTRLPFQNPYFESGLTDESNKTKNSHLRQNKVNCLSQSSPTLVKLMQNSIFFFFFLGFVPRALIQTFNFIWPKCGLISHLCMVENTTQYRLQFTKTYLGSDMNFSSMGHILVFSAISVIPVSTNRSSALSSVTLSTSARCHTSPSDWLMQAMPGIHSDSASVFSSGEIFKRKLVTFKALKLSSNKLNIVNLPCKASAYFTSLQVTWFF